jgi:hypothetical protein
MGFPFEHGLHQTLIAMRLAEQLGVDRASASQTYYASLFSHAGCTAVAHVAAEVFGSSMTENFNRSCTGSVRQVFIGLLRSLSDEDVTGLARAAQTGRRLPRMARETQHTPNGDMTARRIHLCEIADGRITAVTTYCNGGWDVELRARHAAEAPMVRP